MAVLFISHSSKDDGVASALVAWLRNNGFTDIFLDHDSLAGGDKWRDELRASAAACRVVLCLVTEQWLQSDECFGEFVAAAYTMGRRIIPVFLKLDEPNLTEAAQRRLAKVRSEDQGITLDPCLTASGGLEVDKDPNVAERLRNGLRAAGALSQVGLDPEVFAVDPKLRPTPFPGLSSFGDADADAALFYGRSREIALVLEELRKMRAEGDLRPFVMLGASGAGKSSLLKAGVIPRLRRERPAWLPLRAFRPGADPLHSFAGAIAASLADFGQVEASGIIRDRLLQAWWGAARERSRELNADGIKALEAALEAEGLRLRTAAGTAGATILVSVDQAEEIARAEGQSGDALADYLRAALSATASKWLVACTVRTDSFPELQAHRRFRGLEARSFDLRAMPTFRFDSVIEQPARRYGVEIEPALVDTLIKDIPNEDALPLLAFALQRLWGQFASSGRLTRDQYDRLGGLKGLIEDAAERALRGFEPEQDVAMPASALPKRLTDLGAATFVPALAQLNDQGAIIRREALWTGFDEEQQELLGRFERWRLVVRKGEGAESIVEVAHEALFREWTRLKHWLEPERARLDALRLLQIDAANWVRNTQNTAFLNHRGKRLREADALAANDNYRKRLGDPEVAYLIACHGLERAARRRVYAVAALVGVLSLALAGGVTAWSQGPWLKRQAYWVVHARALSAGQERELQPGDPPFRECSHCPAMVVLRANSFTMGSTAKAQERPPHRVTIAQPFAVGQFEVMFDEWDACVAHGGACAADVGTAGWGRGHQPVIFVSWQEAQHYVQWLSQVTGRPYRLLSEAEWEYAARAGNPANYSFGPDEATLGDHAWFEGNADGHAHPAEDKKISGRMRLGSTTCTAMSRNGSRIASPRTITRLVRTAPPGPKAIAAAASCAAVPFWIAQLRSAPPAATRRPWTGPRRRSGSALRARLLASGVF